MPDKNPLSDRTEQVLSGFDNSGLDINQGLATHQDQMENWIKQNPNLPVKVGIPDANPVHPKEESKTSQFEKGLRGLGDKKFAPGANEDSFVKESDLPEEAFDKRFDKGYYLHQDTENIYGEKQSGWEKLEYMVPRVIGTATKTIVQGLTAPLVGLGSLATGGNFIKNDYNDWFEAWDKYENEKFPLFQANEEKNSSFLGQIKYGNSWVHLAEFAAMGAGIAATAAIGGGITEGILGAADIAQGTRITSQYLNSIDKLAESTSIISKLETPELQRLASKELMDAANEIWTKSIPEAEKGEELNALLSDINKKYASRINKLEGRKQKVYGAASMLGMNAGMGAKANTDFTNSLVQEYKDKNGVDPSPEEMDKINEMAKAVGQWTFGVGTVMSTYSFHGLLKGMIGKDAENAFLKETNDIIENKGVYSSKNLPFSSEEGDNFISKTGVKAGNLAYKGYKLASKVVDPWAGIGLTEFSLLGPSVENYYHKQYTTGKADFIQDAVGPNVEKIFTKDGLSTFFMGMIGSFPMEIAGKIREGKERTLNTSDAVTAFNKNTSKQFLNDNINSIIRGKDLKEDEVNALRAGDELTKYNSREQQLINYIYPRIKYGMSSFITKDIQGYKEQLNNPESIKKLQEEFNIEGTPDEVKKTLTKYLDHMQDVSDKMENNYKAISLRYGRVPGFKDEHMEKLLYLSSMTDNSTERIRTLSDELQNDKSLQDKFLNRTEGTDWKGGYTTYEPTEDIDRLLTAESRESVIKDEEGKKYLAHQLYDDLHKKIDNLIVDDEKKDQLKKKLDDMVQLNFLRRGYLKQYHDITNNIDKDPNKYTDKNKGYIINPYNEDYEGKNDVKNAALRTFHEFKTSEGNRQLEEGEDYYVGSPISLQTPDGTTEGFRKFKLVKELPEEGKFLIKTEKGTLIPVDAEFLKNHDIGEVRDMSSQAKFYDRNKRKRLVRKIKDSKKELSLEKIKSKQEGLEEDRQEAVKASFEQKKEEFDSKRAELSNINKQINNLQRTIDTNPQKGMGSDMKDLVNNKNLIIQQLKDLENSNNNENFRIHKYYDAEQATQEQLKRELNQDPKDYLDNKAKASYAIALDKINKDSKDRLDDLKNAHAQLKISLTDFQNGELEINRKKEKDIQDLKDKYRDLYNKRLKELQTGNTESGTLQYSPTQDKLQFVNGKGEKSDISTEDFKKGDISKIDGTPWDDADKDFFNNYGKEVEEKNKLETLKSKAVNIENSLINSDKKSYDDPNKDHYVDPSNEAAINQAQVETNEKISSVTGKPNLGAKMPLNRIIRSSMTIDPKSTYYSNLTPSDPVYKWIHSRNEWAERFNSFTSKILEPLKTNFWKNSDLKKKDGQYKQPTVLFVHKGNQDSLGLKGFISNEDLEYAKSIGDTDPIYMVMTHTDENNKKWTIDNNGKKLKEIGSDHSEQDYNNMIFTFRRAKLTWKDGSNAFLPKVVTDKGTVDATPELIKEYTDTFNKETKEILNTSSTQDVIEHSFSISNGQFEKPKGTKRKTTLSETTLVTDANIGYPMVQIATQNRGIHIGDKKVENVPKGVPFWVRGSSVQILDAKKFTPKNKNHIIDTLHWLAETELLPDVSAGKQDPNADRKSAKSKVQEYLASIIFFNHGFEQVKDGENQSIKLDENGFPSNRYGNQISLGRNRKDGLFYLMFGKDHNILFTPESIDTNKEVISNYLDKVHHVTLSKELKREEEKDRTGQGNTHYNEIIGFNEKGIPQDRTWDSYTKYLTSKVDPDGKQRDINEIPLTLNVDKPVNGEPPLKGMYITTRNDNKKKEVIKEPERKEVKVISQEEDIENRRQQELNDYNYQHIAKIETYEGLDDNGNKETFEIITTKDGKKRIEKDRHIINKGFNKEISNEKLLEFTDNPTKISEKTGEEHDKEIRGKGGKTVADKINSKYDNELEDYRKNKKDIKDNTLKIGEETIHLDGKTPNTDTSTKKIIGDVVYTASREGDKISIDISSIDGLSLKELKDPEAIEFFKQDSITGTKLITNKLQKELDKQLEEEKENKIEEPVVIPTPEVKTDNPVVTNEVADAVAASMLARRAEKQSGRDKAEEGKSFIKDMITSDLQKGIQLENIQAFKDFMAKVLPQFKVSDLPYSIRNGKGGYSWGQYDHAYKTITLGVDAIEGVGFHEAFHSVWESFLSPKEQRNLINEFKSREGEYKDRFGKTYKYSDNRSEDDIIEQLADEFREHNLNNKIYDKSPVKMSFFTRLKNFIKNFFGLDKGKNLQQVFDRINSGYYKDASFYNRNSPIRDMIKFSDGSKVTQQTVRDFTNGVVDNIKKYLTIENGGLSAITEGRIKVEDLLNNVKNDINQQLIYPDDKFTAEQVNEFSKIIQPLCDVLTDEKGPYYQLNDKKWQFLVENKIKDKIQSLGLKTIKYKESELEDTLDDNVDQDETDQSSTPDDTTTDEVTKDTNKNPYGVDAFKVNAKDTAPKEIQFLFNTIIEAINDSVEPYNADLKSPLPKTNSLLFNKIVEDNSLFYKTMHNLSYSLTLDDMQTKLQELARKVPSLVDTYNYIFGTEPDKRTREQWVFLSRLFKTFSKYSPEPIMHRSDESGKHYVTSANADTVVDILKKRWESNFKGDSKVSKYNAETQNYSVNPSFKFTKTVDTSSRFKFLHEIGFTGISEDQYRDFVSNNADSQSIKEFSKVVDIIHEGVINFQSGKSKGKAILGKDIFETGKSIGKLAEIAAEMSMDKYASQFQRLDKEFVQTNINMNFYARIVGTIRNSKSIMDYLNSNPRLKNDEYTNHSVLIGTDVREGKEESQFFNKDGTPKKIGLIIDNGKVDESGNRMLLTDMTGSQRASYVLNGILRGRSSGVGVFQMFMPSDQSSDFGMEMEHYIPINSFNSNDKKFGKDAKINKIFKGYLEDELTLIEEAGERMKYEELAKKVNGTPRAKQLRYFKDILSPELVKTITDFITFEDEKTKDLSLDEFFKTIEDKFNADVRIHLQKERDTHFKYLSDEGILTKDTKDNITYYKWNSLNTDFLSEFGITRKSDGQFLFEESQVRKILEFAQLNYKIHNIELSKIFYADPANYKDFLKRSKMYNSGTELNFHSDEFNQAANTDYNQVKVGEKNFQLKEGDPGYRKFTHNFKGFTFNHGEKSNNSTVVSKGINLIARILFNQPESIKKYSEENNEIDAQSYSSMEAMREFDLKAGTWSSRHEELYQYKAAKKRLNRQERLEKSEKGLRDKMFNDDRTNYYHSDTNVLGELSSRGEELKKLDQELVDKLSKKIETNPQNYSGLLNVKKYLGAGFSDNQDFNSPNGLKTSTLNLHDYDGMEGSKLEDLYLFMEKHDIDYIGPPSQHKFGRIEGSPDLYNIDKDYESMGALALHSLSAQEVNDKAYFQPLENYNKIVETAGQHDEGTIGTQLRVQATVDMMNSGLPKDFYNPNEHTFSEKRSEWNKLSPTQKKATSPIYRLHSEMNDALKGMINQAKPEVYNQLGLGEKDGKTVITNSKKLLSFLKDMTNTYNIPANLRDALKITLDKDGNETIRLDQLANRQSLEYIVNSAIEKYVVRPKMNGGPKILVSGAMWEKNNRQGMAFDPKENKWIDIDTQEKFDDAKKKGLKIQLTSNDLKFYTEQDDKVKGMEIKVNNHFKDKMLEWAKENKKELVSDEDLLKYLQSAEGEKLLTGVGFRIPSQGLNSFDVFRIKGFIDPSLGDVVVVPSEITTKVGSDFDVDKLNTYIKNFYLDENGMPKLVKFYDKLTEENLEKIYEQKVALAKYNKTPLEGIDKDDLLETTFNDKSISELDNIVSSTEKELKSINNFINRYKYEIDPYKVNTKEAIHNNYFDLLQETILHESNLEKLLTPNSTDYLEDIDKLISKAEGSDEVGRNKNDINYAKQLDMMWVNQKRQEVLEAKNATSISANGVTSHAMMQSFPYHLAPKIDIKLPHAKINIGTQEDPINVTSLAGTTNKEGQYISEILSQIVNTTVDAANNPILMRILPSIDAFSQALFLIRSGVDPKYTFFFLKQPIIKEYIRVSNRMKNSDNPRNYKERAKQAVIETFKGGTEINPDQFEFSNKEGTGLQDMLTSWAEQNKYDIVNNQRRKKGFAESKKAVQRSILNEFLKYDELTQELFSQQQGSYWGNMRKATDNNVFLKNYTYNKAEQNKNFIGLHDNMSDSWFGTLKNTVSELSDGLNSALFKMTSPLAENQTRGAMEYIAGKMIKGGQEAKNKLMNRVKSAFMDHLTLNFAKDKEGRTLGDQITELSLGPDSVANRLQKIQEKLEEIKKTDPNASILQNSALKKLMATISNPRNPKIVSIEVKPNGTNEKEDFTSSLEELKEHGGLEGIDIAKFYEDFVKLGILQSGTGPGRISYNDLIPHEDFEFYTSQGISALENNNPEINSFDKNKAFWRTNWQDDRVVERRFKNERKILNDGSFVVTLSAKTKEGEPRSYSPVVKIKRPIEIKDPKTGNLREATTLELASMRNNNLDFKENLWITEGYEQVMNPDGTPFIHMRVENKKEVEKYVYRPINLWGDGRNLSESYTDTRPSVLDKNLKINEMPNDQFLDHFEKTGIDDTKVDNTPTPEDRMTDQQKVEEAMYSEPEHDPNNPTPDHPDYAAFQERKYMDEDGDNEEPYGYDDVQEGEAMPDDPDTDYNENKIEGETKKDFGKRKFKEQQNRRAATPEKLTTKDKPDCI